MYSFLVFLTIQLGLEKSNYEALLRAPFQLYQYNPHTTASSLSCLPDTTHDCTSRESHSYRHAQAGFQSMRIEPFLMQNRTHRVAETMPR